MNLPSVTALGQINIILTGFDFSQAFSVSVRVCEIRERFSV
jgi:hypothetical protein